MKIVHLIFLLTISNIAMGQLHKPLTVDSKKDFKFKNEGKVLKWWEGNETVNSDMLVNNDSLTDIKFTKAKLRGDTLDIEIYQNDESHDHHYKIEIIKGKYTVDYYFSLPVDTADRRIQTLDFKLILNRKNFKKGIVIRGYTEFKGKCTENCYDDIIIAKGFFKTVIE